MATLPCSISPEQWSVSLVPAITRKYTEKFIELFAIMKFLTMASNCMKFKMILWLELHGTLHEFSRALKTESTNETVI